MANLLHTSERDFQSAADWDMTGCTLTPGTSSTGGNPYGVTGPQGRMDVTVAGDAKFQLHRYVQASAMKAHRCGAWVWTAASQNFGAGIDWYDSTFGYLSTSSLNSPNTASTWSPFAAGAPTAPLNAVWAKIWFIARSATVGQQLWFALAAYAIVNPPWREHNQGTPFMQFRRAIGSLVQSPGVRGDCEQQVVERKKGRNLSVDVLAGASYIRGSDVVDQGTYYCESDATVNVPISENNAGDWRTTSIFAQVVDAQFSTFAGPPQPNTWKFIALDGAAVWPYTAPATPPSSLRLADVGVAPGTRAIMQSNIVDRRTFLQTRGPQLYTLDGSNVLLQANTGPWVLTNQWGWGAGWVFIPYATPFPNRTISVLNTDTGPWNGDGKIRVFNLPGQARNGFWVAVTYDGQPYRGWLYLRYTAIGN